MEASSQPVAGYGVADRQREERQGRDQKHQIEHDGSPALRFSRQANRRATIRKRCGMPGGDIKEK
jgi:hypothetical protein